MGYPPGGGPGFAVLAVCYSGPAGGYDRAMRPFARLGEPARNSVAAIDYVALQRSSDHSDPRAMVSYVKDGFVEGISAELIDTILEGLEANPGRLSQCYFQHAGGAIGRVPADATAFVHRYATCFWIE